MAGLLAAHVLRRHTPLVCEAQPSLPNNHSAVLRFRSDAVSRATGIPFRKVNVQKAAWWKGELVTTPTLAMANAYSQKVLGRVQERSILNLAPAERWVAPPDFIDQLARSVSVQYDTALTAEHLPEDWARPMISTIPMDQLMALVEWPDRPPFQYRSIWTVQVLVTRPEVDLYQSVYFPEIEDLPYRASFTGTGLTLEFADLVHETPDITVRHVLQDCFGLPSRTAYTAIGLHHQRYGKLQPIPDPVRRAFILAMTDRFGVYSVGRFATWRQILLDDVVHDLDLVARMIEERSSYRWHLPTVFPAKEPS